MQRRGSSRIRSFAASQEFAEQKREVREGNCRLSLSRDHNKWPLATGLALGKTIVASDLPVFRELLTDRKMDCLSTRKIPPNQQ
jgi:hypothetical protein